jgi:hypothetical protein
MLRTIFFAWVFLGTALSVSAQTNANPFELVHRLPRESRNADGSAAGPTNPFDVVPHRTPGVTKTLGENETTPFRPFAILPTGGGLANGTLLGVLIAVFAFLTFSIAANRSAVEKAWRGFLNDASLSLAQREASGIVGSIPYYLLYINFLLNAGLFLFLVTRFFRRETYNNAGFLLICFAAVAIYFLSKHLMLSIAQWLFPVEKEVRRYNLLIIIFNCVLGLFLVPLNLVVAFGTNTNYQGLLLFWMLGLVTIFFVYRAVRALPIAYKFLGESTFHFFLYLCTVEIAPLLLILKIATLQS